MDFKAKLTEYMELTGCTARELSEASGLSAAAVSRYCSGKRTPAASSEQLKKLSAGIAALCLEKGIEGSDYDSIFSSFHAILDPEVDAAAFSARVDHIITELNINVASLSKALNYDASFISRIRTGNRTPADVSAFIRKFSFYIVNTYDETAILHLLDKQAPDSGKNPSTPEYLMELLEHFLLNSSPTPPAQVTNFLHKLDDFDLNEYTRTIRFNELKVPTAPFRFPAFQEYFGIDGQKQGEINFLKNTVLSKSKEPVFMYSDMDMEDMSQDIDFSKNWMFGLALMLKKT